MAEETNPLEELLVDELKDIYSAENQIIKALPKMAKAASAPELKRAFERHLEETRRQVERLDQIGGISRNVLVLCDHSGNRFSNKTNLIRCQEVP